MWIYVGNLQDISSPSGRLFRNQNGKEIGVFHLSDGRVLAVDNHCPHRKGPLTEGIVSGQHVFCPLHDWKIDLVSGEAQAPDSGCVKTFPVKLEGEKIFVDC